MMLKSASFSLLAVATSFTALLAPAQAFTPFNLTQTFNNPTPESGDLFGFSAFINGTDIFIGAFGDNTGADDAGSAYLYQQEVSDKVHKPVSVLALLGLGLGALVAKGKKQY